MAFLLPMCCVPWVMLSRGCWRLQENLVAKCRALNEEGITAYHWAGSLQVRPVRQHPMHACTAH